MVSYFDSITTVSKVSQMCSLRLCLRRILCCLKKTHPQTVWLKNLKRIVVTKTLSPKNTLKNQNKNIRVTAWGTYIIYFICKNIHCTYTIHMYMYNVHIHCYIYFISLVSMFKFQLLTCCSAIPCHIKSCNIWMGVWSVTIKVYIHFIA